MYDVLEKKQCWPISLIELAHW